MNATIAAGTGTVHAVRPKAKGRKTMVTLCGAEHVRTKNGIYTKRLRMVADGITCKHCQRKAPMPVPVVTVPAGLDDALTKVDNATPVVVESEQPEIFETLAIGIWEQMPMF